VKKIKLEIDFLLSDIVNNSLYLYPLILKVCLDVCSDYMRVLYRNYIESSLVISNSSHINNGLYHKGNYIIANET
jgi:hypothetical protein